MARYDDKQTTPDSEAYLLNRLRKCDPTDIRVKFEPINEQEEDYECHPEHYVRQANYKSIRNRSCREVLRLRMTTRQHVIPKKMMRYAIGRERYGKVYKLLTGAAATPLTRIDSGADPSKEDPVRAAYFSPGSETIYANDVYNDYDPTVTSPDIDGIDREVLTSVIEGDIIRSGMGRYVPLPEGVTIGNVKRGEVPPVCMFCKSDNGGRDKPMMLSVGCTRDEHLDGSCHVCDSCALAKYRRFVMDFAIIRQKRTMRCNGGRAITESKPLVMTTSDMPLPTCDVCLQPIECFVGECRDDDEEYDYDQNRCDVDKFIRDGVPIGGGENETVVFESIKQKRMRFATGLVYYVYKITGDKTLATFLRQVYHHAYSYDD